MKLLTAAIEKAFEKNPLGSHDGEWTQAKVIVKFFNPYGVGTWLITEANREDDDWLMFGWIELGGEWECGYVSFNELQSLKTRWGTPMIEREIYTGIRKHTVEELMEQ